MIDSSYIEVEVHPAQCKIFEKKFPYFDKGGNNSNRYTDINNGPRFLRELIESPIKWEMKGRYTDNQDYLASVFVCAGDIKADGKPIFYTPVVQLNEKIEPIILSKDLPSDNLESLEEISKLVRHSQTIMFLYSNFWELSKEKKENYIHSLLVNSVKRGLDGHF